MYTVKRRRIPRGDPGTEATVRAMHKLSRAATRDGRVLAWAHDVVRFVPERDDDATAHAFLQWTRKAFRYTKDPEGREAVKTPATMLIEYERNGRIVEDCDGQVTLLLAGLKAVGIPAEPVVMATTPYDYEHVYLRYWSSRKGWVSMDPIVRRTQPGWQPSGATRVASCREKGGCVPMPSQAVQGFAGLPPPGVLSIPRAAQRVSRKAHERRQDERAAGPFFQAAQALAPYIPLVYLAYIGYNVMNTRRTWAWRRSRRRAS